jgi:endonuclease/exonuclease/phosphatase family metal-dependent hydrolase
VQVSVGTFNLNNLFSRWSFSGAIEAIEEGGQASSVTVSYRFDDPSTYRVRTFRGRLVKAKDEVDTDRIAQRILTIDVDVLAVQEVENIGILRQFDREQLGGLYNYQVLIEGNDPRFIDIAVLSKLPIGAVSSYQTAVHPDDPTRPVFSRDLQEVEIWSTGRTIKLFTLYNNHLKSNFVPFGEDPAAGAAKANARRRRQTETVSRIVEARMRRDSRYIVLGDMNDPPESPHLAPMTQAPGLGLINALTTPTETRPAKAEKPGEAPHSKTWTHRYKKSGQRPEHELYDQIWLSPSLAEKQTGSFIDRRERHGGDGSDHDPAWITLEL